MDPCLTTGGKDDSADTGLRPKVVREYVLGIAGLEPPGRSSSYFAHRLLVDRETSWDRRYERRREPDRTPTEHSLAGLTNELYSSAALLAGDKPYSVGLGNLRLG